MAMIQVKNLTFGYEGNAEDIFNQLSFQADTDWRLGLIGRNGRGKTTLLKLLAGTLSGSGSITSPAAFSYFPYPVDQTAETLEAALRPVLEEAGSWQLRRELSLLGAAPEILKQPLKTLSPGERAKAMLAALFLREDQFLLIDEPTNHLDMQGRALLSAYLKRKRGFMIVSHDRMFLDGCVDHIMALNKNGIEIQSGNFTSWDENRRRTEQFEQGRQDQLRKEIRKLEAAVRENARWSEQAEKEKKGKNAAGLHPDRGYLGKKAAKGMKRAKNIERRREAAAAEKKKLLLNRESVEALKLHPEQHHSRRLVALDEVSLCFAGRTVVSHLSFTVEQGDRLAICGQNGSGKSSILRLIRGEIEPAAGICRVASGLKISDLPQETRHLSGGLRDFIRMRGLEESRFKTILRKLDFTRAQFEIPLEYLSEGQRKKLLIAACLCESAHLYIWDEPLNYIDVFSRMQLEELLLESRPTMIFVEHDAVFCRNIATKTMTL